VSILTQPELIRVKNPRDYPKHVEIGKHGLIVEYAGHAGLLLPQVPIEWGWDVEEFLSQTCMKAGLMPDCWLYKGVRISRFSAQIFAEVTPTGRVEERRLYRCSQSVDDFG
ncbi:MAG: TIGR00296 family protein, partial [Hadesarchaea archaeon]|nr:TIGR00296 family protein [Hadesarchaea archaeon]